MISFPLSFSLSFSFYFLNDSIIVGTVNEYSLISYVTGQSSVIFSLPDVSREMAMRRRLDPSMKVHNQSFNPLQPWQNTNPNRALSLSFPTWSSNESSSAWVVFGANEWFIGVEENAL
ncbi:hypothetical protein V8G54_013421 [Vigna mungo]|uniref:Uncharacterized protein n=1 Tax=Vigna mungo TaxID=3915 RepID=A0AAQ3NTB4_VIGMU